MKFQELEQYIQKGMAAQAELVRRQSEDFARIAKERSEKLKEEAKQTQEKLILEQKKAIENYDRISKEQQQLIEKMIADQHRKLSELSEQQQQAENRAAEALSSYKKSHEDALEGLRKAYVQQQNEKNRALAELQKSYEGKQEELEEAYRDKQRALQTKLDEHLQKALAANTQRIEEETKENRDKLRDWFTSENEQRERELTKVNAVVTDAVKEIEGKKKEIRESLRESKNLRTSIEEYTDKVERKARSMTLPTVLSVISIVFVLVLAVLLFLGMLPIADKKVPAPVMTPIPVTAAPTQQPTDTPSPTPTPTATHKETPPPTPTEKATESPIPTPFVPSKGSDYTAYENYQAAEDGDRIEVRSYVFLKLPLDTENNKASFYCQSPDGGYFIKDAVLDGDTYGRLAPGTHVQIVGTKSFDNGMPYLTDAEIKLLEDASYTAEPLSQDTWIGNPSDYYNSVVCFENVCIEVPVGELAPDQTVGEYSGNYEETTGRFVLNPLYCTKEGMEKMTTWGAGDTLTVVAILNPDSIGHYVLSAERTPTPEATLAPDSEKMAETGTD